MAREDDEARSDGNGGAPGGEPFSLDDLVVPDDARELAADARALRRERRVRGRRARLTRLLVTRRGRRYGVSGPIVVGVLLLVAGTASLMLLFQPRRTTTRPAPLATGVRDVGQEGGLLVDVTIRRADGQVIRIRDYRPSVVALLPQPCDCAGRLVTYGLAALRHNLAFLLVAPGLPTAPPELANRSVVRASEATGRLARSYRVGREPVLLLIRGDGVVNRVLTREPTPGALDGELAVLVATGAAVGAGR